VVDTSGDQVRITDVHLHAPQGLSSGHIPTIDFGLLLQAVTGSVTMQDGRSAPVATALCAPHDTPASETVAATEPAEQPALPAAPKGRAGKYPPAKAVKKAAATKTSPAAARKRNAASTATPAKDQPSARQSRAATTTATPATSGRVYRRTPDDLAAVLAQVETVAGVAEHYQVPRYTAQGWVSRLRATA
jgi:hypothetical protein